MTTKTRYCDECAHRRLYSEGAAESPPCELGHKPRFYKPYEYQHDYNWGWKRRCEDFKEKRDDHPANP